jgi:hypothetical protein
MRFMRWVSAWMAAGAIVLVIAPAASAQDNPQALRQEIDQLRREFEALKQQYGDRLTALETKLATAGGVAPPAAAAAPQAAALPPALVTDPTAPPAIGGASQQGSSVTNAKVFNPDMAVIGDFLGSAGQPNPINQVPTLEMHESELSLQAVVDPYARADFFISFGQEGVELEEGYLTFTSLPGGLLTKVGKMRAAFGKVNALHNHVLPWADRPLVTQNLVGGEEGISDAGISVARLISNPWVFLEATGQVFRGNSGDLFHAYDRAGLTYVGHLRAYKDFTDDSNIDFGFSYARGNTPSSLSLASENDLKTNLYGFDATVRWRPLQRSIYRSFVGRTEWIWSRRQYESSQPIASQSGMYVSGDYQFARRWFAGARYDNTSSSYDVSLRDNGASLLLTYWPSEFSQIRGQYRRTNYAIAKSVNELLFQLQFSIGAHGAHPF